MNGSSKQTFIRRPVGLSQPTLEIRALDFKRSRIGKLKISAYPSIIMISHFWIRFYRFNTPCCKIDLASVIAPRLIIDDPIVHRLLHLPQISKWKMIPRFRQIVVSRIDLCNEDAFGHSTPFTSFGSENEARLR